MDDQACCRRRWEWGRWTKQNKKITKTTIKQILSSAYCCGSPWLSGAVTVMVDAVVDVLCASRCVVCVLLLAVCERGTYLGVCRPFLWADYVGRFCPQNFSSTFNEPSAKPTRVRALGTNQRSRARLIWIKRAALAWLPLKPSCLNRSIRDSTRQLADWTNCFWQRKGKEIGVGGKEQPGLQEYHQLIEDERLIS